MPSREKSWDEHVCILGHARPADADSPRPKDSDRTHKIILKTAGKTIVAVAVER